MTAPKRRWPQFSLRTMFVVVAVLGCSLGYELNWIRQRRALVHEAEILDRKFQNYVTGVTSDVIPPVGSTLSQRLLSFLGEPATESCCVWVWNEGISDVDFAQSPKVRRARRLFPEAEIAAVRFYADLVADDDKLYDELSSLISR